MRLQQLDGQLTRIATAPVRAAEHDAVAAQIVLDTLPQPGDIPPIAFSPPAHRPRCALRPLAQLRGAIDKPSGMRCAALARLPRLPGARAVDSELCAMRTQLEHACASARDAVQIARSSPSVLAATDFVAGWRAFHVAAAACARRRATRASAPSARVTAAPMSAAARRRAVQSVCQMRASTAAAAVLIATQPILARAARVVNIRRDMRAAQAAAACAIAAAARYAAVHM